jgi:hypothetical protein
MDERLDLNWLAFQYIAGELSHRECESFEQRLTRDQRAREAVAEAVHLAQCTVVAEAELAQVSPVATSNSSVWGRNLCVVLSTASCLALFVATHGMPGPERVFRPEQAISRTANGLHELAIIWSESREDWDEPVLEAEPPEDDPMTGLSELGTVQVEMEDDGFASDWIQQAVFTIRYRGAEEAGGVSSDRGADL